MALPNQGKGPRQGLGIPAVRAVSHSRDDERLVAGILAGSRVHYDLLYESAFHRVYHYALHRLGAPGPAEAVTRNVLFTVFRELPHWPGHPSLLAWVFGIARNAVERRLLAAHSRPAADDSGPGCFSTGGN